jgi:alpha-N-acetylglucosaminidase
MNNMGAWGGPLDMQWITSQRDLQLQILGAMRAYGMTPALPGWSGRVPHAILGPLPSLQLFQLPSWAGFNSTYSSAWNVDPTDAAFVSLGVRYTNMTMQAYGTDHLWQADLYNEMDPASDGKRLGGCA